MKSPEKYKEILEDNSELRIWEHLPNGCSIGTMGYSKKNVAILKQLLKSFEEQYQEVIDDKASEEELRLYEKSGKLFIYFDENMTPISMNGCVFNYDNATVDFISARGNLKSLYFYGLSTLKEHRGKGACRALINFAIDFARYNDFDFVYARTDLTNSNSEWLMQRAGLEICKYDNQIIAEWVDVTDTKGDYRLHMWKPLKSGITIFPKDVAFFAADDQERCIASTEAYQKRIG